jgi:hypothetical protein
MGGGMVMASENISKKKVLGLTNALETAYIDPSRYGIVIDAASQICSLLKDPEVSLSMPEKMRVVKSLAKAKVRAFMDGPTDDYKAFKALDAISGDLVQLL